MREGVFTGAGCKCGCGALWSSRLTIFETLMFWSGAWLRPDYTGVEGIEAPLGGEINAQLKSLELMSEPIEGV